MRMSIAVITASLLFVATPIFAQNQLKVGDPVPEFKLPYATKDTIVFSGISHEDLAGKAYVLAFYPADWSSGCTKEVCTLRDAMTDFDGLHVAVLGVSVDSPFSHFHWAQQENLNFKLLSDQTHSFGKAMGVYDDARGVFKRSVFVVGPDGKLKYINYNYSVKDNHDFETFKKALATK